MKYHSASDIFKFTWEQVSCAIWNRYPNPYSTHVISEDTVSRKVINGKLVSHRLITKHSYVPKFGELFMRGGRKQVCVLEESIVDPIAKTVTTYTSNIGLNNVCTVDEKCVYSPGSDNTSWTECQRHLWVSGRNHRLAGALHSFVLQLVKKHMHKTIQGFNFTLNRMFSPELLADQSLLKMNKDKLIESTGKIKESAQKAKESAKELASKKSKSCVSQ